jgi:hypothetical protein
VRSSSNCCAGNKEERNEQHREFGHGRGRLLDLKKQTIRKAFLSAAPSQHQCDVPGVRFRIKL